MLFLKSLLIKTHMIFFCALFYSLCVLVFKFYFMFKFVIYLKLDFVHDMKQRLRFFVPPMWMWFFSLDLSMCWNILIDFRRLNQPCILWSEVKVAQSCLTLWHCGLCPWNSLGPNTGVGSLSLLQGIFPTHPGIKARSPALHLPAEP